jgi:hypothetical protein
MNYEQKYLKYKQKYLELKKQIGGVDAVINRIFYIPLNPAETYGVIKGEKINTTINDVSKAIGAVAQPISKEQLISHLQSVNRCTIQDETNNNITAFCNDIHQSADLVIGVMDTLGTCAVVNIYTYKTGDSLLFIHKAISDSTTKGKMAALINHILKPFATALGIKIIATTPLDDASLNFWMHMGFLDGRSTSGYLELRVP